VGDQGAVLEESLLDDGLGKLGDASEDEAVAVVALERKRARIDHHRAPADRDGGEQASGARQRDSAALSTSGERVSSSSHSRSYASAGRRWPAVNLTSN
jgi:hypothetical protein